jgi:hypothetical protein
MISKLLRLYKRSHGLRQICNIAVYIAHSACTIHLLNLPDKNARRDIIHGVKHLEEIAEGWLGARRTLSILAVLARKWNIELPEEADAVLTRTEAKYGSYTGDISSPSSEQGRAMGTVINSSLQYGQQVWQRPPPPVPAQSGFFTNDATTAIETMARPQTSDAVQNVPYAGVDQVQAQQYAQALPNQQQTPNRHRPSRSMQARPVGNSPGGMFGGVEQLLRDSSDWAYRDQAQQQQVQPSAPLTTAAVPPFSMPNGAGTNNAVAPNAYPMMTWMNGSNPYTNMMNYDEEEWYR